ncbi:hypothetical protein HNO89_001791 [Sporosarcina luteola]|nr:hypothetical protein [Sporosarcina luteola]
MTYFIWNTSKTVGKCLYKYSSMSYIRKNEKTLAPFMQELAIPFSFIQVKSPTCPPAMLLRQYLNNDEYPPA